MQQLARLGQQGRQGFLWQCVRALQTTVNPENLPDALNQRDGITLKGLDTIGTVDSPFLRYGSPVPTLYDFSSSIAAIQDTKVTTLANGMRVATEYIPFTQTATVGIWIDAGSRYETDETNGTAHFLEHMFFKGTKTRQGKDLEIEIENMGAHLNAYTAREHTCYYAKVLKENVPDAVNILGDILQNTELTDKKVEMEKAVILREMQELEGVQEELVFDHLHATAFQHTPLGRTILGPADNVKAMTKEQIEDYIKTHYTGGRMVLAAAGNVDHDALVKQAEKIFSTVAPTPETGHPGYFIAKEPSHFTGSEIRFRDPDMPTVHVAVAFRGASWTDPDAVGLMVMQTMFGAWDKYSGAGYHTGSLIAQKIATQKPPCANSFMAFNTNYHDAGLFGVYSVADKEAALDDLQFIVMDEMTRQCYNTNESDVTRGRNQLKAQMLYSLNNSTGVCEDIGRQLLVYGRRVPKAEMFARIDAVDADALRGVADRFIYDQDLALVSMGDTWALPDYNWHKSRTHYIRY